MKTYPMSDIVSGQQLKFYGIAQSKEFSVHVAPDYQQVFSQTYQSHIYQTVVAGFDESIPDIEPFLNDILALIKVPVIKMPLKSGEQLKSVEQVSKLLLQLGKNQIGTKSLMLVIGGGTLCNAAGFVAVTWSGMEQVIIPTNFTAIGDVAIGSLHMINVGEDKNRLQLYRDPAAVVLDPKFMSSLPDSERRNGLAETVKHAIAQDITLFNELEQHVANKSIFQDDVLFDFALRTAQLKNILMGADPFGQHTQNIFLYGHTIAHAIESAMEYTMPHGEAVSLGLLAELAFFHKPQAEIFTRTKKLLQQIGLPIQMPPNLKIEKIIERLSHSMTNRNTLLIPRVTELGKLDKINGLHTQEFDQTAILKALQTIQ